MEIPQDEGNLQQDKILQSQFIIAQYLAGNIASNKQPTIYKDLIGVQFLGLRVLDLSNNQITSIEQVSFISMPALQKIVLADNKLTKIREIRKCNWPILHELNINSNNILDAETIPLASPCYNFQYLKLELQMHSIPIQSQDLRWLMKFNAVTFYTLFCMNQGRIKKICVFDKLKEKIKGIRIQHQGPAPINLFNAFYDSSDDDFDFF